MNALQQALVKANLVTEKQVKKVANKRCSNCDRKMEIIDGKMACPIYGCRELVKQSS